MKKRIVIGTSCILIVLAALLVWKAGRNTKLQKLSKIEMYYPGDNLTVVTGEENMRKVVALFHSLRVRKTFSDNDDGFVFSIQIYDKDGERIDIITIRSNRIVTNYGYYKCAKDYCDDFLKLYEELQM